MTSISKLSIYHLLLVYASLAKFRGAAISNVSGRLAERLVVITWRIWRGICTTNRNLHSLQVESCNSGMAVCRFMPNKGAAALSSCFSANKLDTTKRGPWIQHFATPHPQQCRQKAP